MFKFEIGKTYNFETYAPSLLGNNFKGVTVLATLDFETASVYADLLPRHKQIYPMLPTGTPDDPTQYIYLRIRFSNRESTVIGVPWIREGSVVEVDSRTVIVKCMGVSTADASRIRDLLTANGFREIEVSVQ